MIRSQSIWTVSDLAALCSFVSLWCFWFWRYFAWKIVEEQAMNLWWKWSSSQLGYSCMWTDLLVSNMNQLRLLWDICSWVHHSGVVLQVEFVAFRFAPTNGTYHGMTLFLSSHCKVDFWVADEKSKQLSADQLAKLSQVMGWLGMWRWKAVWGDLHVYYAYRSHREKHVDYVIMSQCHTLFHISHIWHMIIMYNNLLCACIQASMAGNSQRVNPLSSYVAVISFPFAGAGPSGDGALVSWDA